MEQLWDLDECWAPLLTHLIGPAQGPWILADFPQKLVLAREHLDAVCSKTLSTVNTASADPHPAYKCLLSPFPVKLSCWRLGRRQERLLSRRTVSLDMRQHLVGPALSQFLPLYSSESTCTVSHPLCGVQSGMKYDFFHYVPYLLQVK